MYTLLENRNYRFLILLSALGLSQSQQAATAAANVPSYVGQYGYTHGCGSGQVGFTSEGAAAAACLKAMNDGNPGYAACPNTSLKLESSAWYANPQYDFVEGVEKSGSQYYSYISNSGGACQTTTGSALLRIGRDRIVCSSTQRPRGIEDPATVRCVDVSKTAVPGNGGGNLGPKTPSPDVGDPVDTSTGNVWKTERDLSLPTGGLDLVRTYNSIPFTAFEPSGRRMFGTHWATKYDTSITQTTETQFTRNNDQACFRWSDTQVVFCEGLRYPAHEPIPKAIKLTRPDGKFYVFSGPAAAVAWRTSSPGVEAYVVPSFNPEGTRIVSYVYHSEREKEFYDEAGRLLWIAGPNGKQTLTYATDNVGDSAVSRYPSDAPVCASQGASGAVSPDKLLCVTDSYGRQLQFRYPTPVSIEISAPGGERFTYELGTSLDRVTFPDGTTRRYLYNEPDRINASSICSPAQLTASASSRLRNNLTGIIDESGQRAFSWSYGCDGLPVSSEIGNGMNKIAYSFASAYADENRTTQISHTVGLPGAEATKATAYVSKEISGVMRFIGQTSRCTECGPIANRTYDTSGNIASETDRGGITTKYTYNSRNLELTKVEASGHSITRTTTTAWHPTLKLPLQIAEPKLLRTYTYDDKDNLTSQTEQATSDETGAAGFGASIVGQARTWSYTYDTNNNRLTVTGPRTDVSQTTRYEYDAQGNLKAVTNPAGHVTAYENYDANGRVGRIVAPDGKTTSFTYTVRGFISQVRVQAGSVIATTSTEYGPTGLISRVTQPDGTWMSYVYDSAGRLVQTDHSDGTRVAITRDVTGNKVREQVYNAQGVVTSSIRRILDTSSRVMEEIVE